MFAKKGHLYFTKYSDHVLFAWLAPIFNSFFFRSVSSIRVVLFWLFGLLFGFLFIATQEKYIHLYYFEYILEYVWRSSFSMASSSQIFYFYFPFLVFFSNALSLFFLGSFPLVCRDFFAFGFCDGWTEENTSCIYNKPIHRLVCGLLRWHWSCFFKFSAKWDSLRFGIGSKHQKKSVHWDEELTFQN